ncbi:MAG TPA: hypothetical protein VK400_13695 [Pyrinomonadaceae bacterium]|nr:hypothetical protein [Pyrinomonadaceae bacterium]
MVDRSDERGDAPVSKPISKATYIMIAALIIFLIIASVLFYRFLSAPAGNP